jgi:hypothetical protein
LNEQRIQQVLEIEKQAEAIHAAAIRDAEQVQQQADRDARSLVETTRSAAQEEARRLVENASASDECAQILAQSEEKSCQIETLAAKHHAEAVAFVLDQLVGKE